MRVRSEDFAVTLVMLVILAAFSDVALRWGPWW
jgi:hypothetical protein